MIAKLFAREDDFDSVINPLADQAGVEPELVKAFIALESNFNPKATRYEAHLKPVKIPGLERGGDRSYGLMQVLYRTAWGLGYRGAATGLYDPANSIKYGIKFIADCVRSAKRRGLGVEAAISEYNGGYRPSLGFGRVALRTVRLKNGHVVHPGEFANKAYVNIVMKNYRHFKARAAEQTEVASNDDDTQRDDTPQPVMYAPRRSVPVRPPARVAASVSQLPSFLSWLRFF